MKRLSKEEKSLRIAQIATRHNHNECRVTVNTHCHCSLEIYAVNTGEVIQCSVCEAKRK